MDIKRIFELAVENGASDVHLVNGLRPMLRVNGRLFSIEKYANSKELKSVNDSLDADNDRVVIENTDDDKSISGLAVNKSLINEADLKSEMVEKYVLSDDDEIINNNDFKALSQTKKLKGFEKHDLSFVSNKEMEKIVRGILSKSQAEKFYKKKDLDFSYQFLKSRFRVNLSFEKGNIKMVARTIVESMPTMEMLDMPQQIYKLLSSNQGLILLTGPTGCGKSTSLAAMINHINENRNCNIVTLEDPIEFIFQPKQSIVSQRELGRDMMDFSSGLRHVLRQDPDVIMVGEMRDLETISTAITLAETGHLVLATLHTCNASQTVDRIIDIFPPHQQNQIKSQLSLILSAVISQVLVPNTNGGRVAVREILFNNSAVANLIREQKISQIKSVIDTHLGEGMVSFERSIKDLLARNIISKEVAQNLLGDRTFIS